MQAWCLDRGPVQLVESSRFCRSRTARRVFARELSELTCRDDAFVDVWERAELIQMKACLVV